MTRREAVIKMAMLMGATVVGPRLFAANFDKIALAPEPGVFSADEVALLDEIGDTILPATDVPGAKAAGIGAFISMMMRDCYDVRDQNALKEGLLTIDHLFKTRFGGTFIKGRAEDRTTLLNELDQEQKRSNPHPRKKSDIAQRQNEGPHYFLIIKELTILGYFTSEIGCTQALKFIEVPGHYDGAVDYKPGDHAWF